MPYTDHELERLLLAGESDLVERKATWNGDAPNTGRQAICAFANDLPNHRRAGVLFVGVSDSGDPSNLPITDELLRTLADIRTDGKTLPPPTMTVEKRSLQGTDVAVVTVEPSDAPPVRYDGRIWVRTGPRRDIANAQDERILNERRRSRDIPFDINPLPTCPLAALSRVAFEQEYLPQAVASDIISMNDRSYEQRLASLRMIASAQDPVPTILGVLVLGISPRDWIPGAYIQFLRIHGSRLDEPVIDEAAIDGSLSQILRRIDEKLDSHNRTTVDIVSGNREVRMSPYPRAALQQLVRNAVMHRTYEHTNAPVRVTWFDDRIEIMSPGGPFGIVNRENFGLPDVTDYRNPHLAEAMKVLGFVQRFGVGIGLARSALRQGGHPELTFDVQPTTVLATVRRKP